jgi:tetratricopeptide (TPR) repeat protein
MLCPTFGATYCIVGQIEKFILDEPDGAERIRKGYRLATCDPIACFVAGFLDVVEGRDEECIEKFKRAVQLDGSLFKDVVDIYVNHLSQPHLAISAAGNNVGQLNLVVNALEDMQYNDLAEQTREKIKDLLKAKCSQPDAPASAFASLANIYMEQQDNEAAIEYYRRALTLNYGEVHWRFELAQLLARMERVPEAVHEIRICLRLCPQFKAAREFMADLSVHPDTFSKEIKSP